MVDLVYCLKNLLFFDIPLLYYFVTLRSLIIGISLSFGISLSNPIFSVSLSTVPDSFCGELLDNFTVLSAYLLPMKLPAASAVF